MATHPAHIQTHQDRGACTFYGEIGRVCEPADISSPTRMSHGNRNNPNDALLRGSTCRIWTRFTAFSNYFCRLTGCRDYCKSGNERSKLVRANIEVTAARHRNGALEMSAIVFTRNFSRIGQLSRSIVRRSHGTEKANIFRSETRTSGYFLSPGSYFNSLRMFSRSTPFSFHDSRSGRTYFFSSLSRARFT